MDVGGDKALTTYSAKRWGEWFVLLVWVALVVWYVCACLSCQAGTNNCICRKRHRVSACTWFTNCGESVSIVASSSYAMEVYDVSAPSTVWTSESDAVSCLGTAQADCVMGALNSCTVTVVPAWVTCMVYVWQGSSNRPWGFAYSGAGGYSWSYCGTSSNCPVNGSYSQVYTSGWDCQEVWGGFTNCSRLVSRWWVEIFQ